ncbi:hypothetical protein JXA48_03385 [Candidatus Woesearchaeota archaeon]|nr:hypothetical protein [Candidatus Woesearchaeota archaeon]
MRRYYHNQGGIDRRNKLASFLAIVSGAMLIASGTTGVSSWQRIHDATIAVINIPLVERLFFLVFILASLGGLTVIWGAILIRKNFVRTGKLLIWLGSGIGLVSLLVDLFTTVSNDGLSLAILFSLAPLGVLLSFVAQIIAKPTRYY